jgi:hypothetical protein
VLRLFRELEKNANIRVVWVSQRRLAPETLVEHPNLLQYSIDELDNTSMTLLLTELLNPRAASPSTLKTLAPSLNGHPATAYFVGRLVNDGQRSLESVLTQMQTIAAFQDRFLNEIITETVIGREAMQLLSLLSFLPAADYTLLRDILKGADSHALSSALGDLTDSCLLTYSMDTGYKIPEIVRSNILRNQPGVPFELLQRGLKYWARESPRKR